MDPRAEGPGATIAYGETTLTKAETWAPATVEARQRPTREPLYHKDKSFTDSGAL